jgi:DnaK suppressor protein
MNVHFSGRTEAMRQRRIGVIRKKLVRQMEQLCSNADKTLKTMKNTEGATADPFDLAAIESNKYVELACRGRERDLMLAIKETVLRIDRGLYGMCDSCGRVIDEKRLLIEPMSKLCAECQAEKEGILRRNNKQEAVRGASTIHV